MSLASSTADIAMINVVMTASDGSGSVWQDPVQMVPLGMGEDATAFVARIKAALPLVNNLRVYFNEHSFNADGSMHPQTEAFFAAAVAAGYSLTVCYAEGDAQNIGIGKDRWPSLTNTQAFAALEENFADVSGAWTRMLAWMEAHPEVKSGVWGWELMNESAGYRHSIRANGPGDGLSYTDFIRLYADHATALADMIDAQAAGKILVGGWGYNGEFLVLDEAAIHGTTALNYIRQSVGEDLVWSAHLYPGWMSTNLATTPDELIARLTEVFAPVAGDAVMITEINADGQVDNPAEITYDDFFTASYQWFADNGMGLGWFPGLQTGASHLLYLEANGTNTYRHQHSLAHALNAYSRGFEAGEAAVAETLTARQVSVKLRNESYETTAGEATFDTVRKAGFAFGYGADDQLNGLDDSNDFLYGGRGHDRLVGLAADDFLFGQQDNDLLEGGAGLDNLFGGEGRDRLDGGAGRDYLDGGRGNDTYAVTDTLDAIVEHAGFGTDRVDTALNSYALGAQLEQLLYIGTGTFAGTGNTLANRITGGALADVLQGRDGNDTLYGGAGNDRLIGGAGADYLSGGDGIDTVSYQVAGAGVAADLKASLTANAGEATGDRFAGVENLTGSAHADRLWGNLGANTLSGSGGGDRLHGRAGNDQLFGGAGADRFIFARGDDLDRVRDFENDVDTIYVSGFAGVTTVAQALARADQVGANVVFDFGAGDKLTVVNTTIAALGNDIALF